MSSTSSPSEPPQEVAAIRREIARALKLKDEEGRVVGGSKYGVYAFYDYDDEPIYIGQTYEKLSSRIGRHLTGQRSDAVAKSVLDPFEVAEIALWPLWLLEGKSKKKTKEALNSAEFTLYQQCIKQSAHGALLNEKPPAETQTMKLPKPIRESIIPPRIYERRKHPDIRIARRANTIAKLAQVISERKVKTGLRTTLLVQSRRLEHLARLRLDETSKA